ncbi:MAG TPA: molecular chaperone TorD family protein [Candidatus Limnocylindrales bacterium]|nr:molecular chaperone TorD family protein [Candidatus Limnocylindrales bacterium]
MPTRSEKTPNCPLGNEGWAARSVSPPRSVFGNYSPRKPAGAAPLGAGDEAKNESEAYRGQAAQPLQTAIDTAVARTFLYGFLAQAYQDASQEGWMQLTSASSRHDLASAVGALSATTPLLAESVALLDSQLKPELFEPFFTAFLAAFGHAARGRCPLNEIEYGDIKADPLFQPHRLADIAGFYRAFGLQVAEDADERHDHICLELEFMCVLAAKEAYAFEHQLDLDVMALCREAQKRFLREHLGRWTPAFARRLARMTAGSPLHALAVFTRAFIEFECSQHGISPGSEDLLLRPVEEAESMCHSCGITQLPPGALTQTTT